ncbi:MAG TPA: MoxR family ATPase [Ruminiclostridium sp.]
MDLISLRKALELQNYIFDENFIVTLYIALKLEKPLLVEGAAGVGKTEVAKVLAASFNTELIRLQCYEGLDESKALYEWNYQKQLLNIQLNTQTHMKSETKDIKSCDSANDLKLENLFSEEYLLERPLLKSIRSENKTVLLIDEVDKTDEEFEAFLLEMLSDFQVSIPELGTIKAKNKPIVILTSNNTRQLSDALKRRCAYLYIDYPDVEKEIRILKAKLPEVEKKFAEEISTFVASIRQNPKIYKKPSIAETLDWASALLAVGKKKLDEDGVDKTLGFLLKLKEDILEFQKGGGFNRFIDDKLS